MAITKRASYQCTAYASYVGDVKDEVDKCSIVQRFCTEERCEK